MNPSLAPWREDAACFNAPDPELWWAHRDQPVKEARAVAICVVCPVVAQCLAAALVDREDDGIRGGLNPVQRGRLHGRGVPNEYGRRGRTAA